MKSKVIESILEKFESNLWGYHFLIPKEVSQHFIKGNDRRVICTINDTERVHSGLMPLDGQHYILVNKALREKLGLSLGSKVKLELEKDLSEYGMEMPEPLQVLLDQDEEGAQFFHALTPGKQRSLIYIVSKVKNTDSQLNKALAILQHLKDTKGKPNGPQLMQTIKEFNRRGKPF